MKPMFSLKSSICQITIRSAFLYIRDRSISELIKYIWSQKQKTNYAVKYKGLIKTDNYKNLNFKFKRWIKLINLEINRMIEEPR